MQDHVPFFKDPDLNRTLFERGYITLPLLQLDEVEKLKALFYRFHNVEEVEGGLHVSSHVKDNESISSMNDDIRSIFKRAIDTHIENGLTLGGTFISKPANQVDPLHPHQDWSIVDESRFRSYTIWVPLQDTNDENGCMYVLPYSHEYVRGYRHVTIPSVFGHIYDVVWKHMTPVHLKAGEAIVFDHAIGHASKPNTTDQLRIAATHSLISPNAEMRFYWNNDGTVEEYLGENDFYNTESARSGPGHLKKIRDLDFAIHQLDEQEFYNLAGIDSPVKESEVKANPLTSWFRRVFG